jgi:hypothetical protein
MKGPRDDIYTATRPLILQVAGLLLLGSLTAWTMSFADSSWARAIGGLLLLACGSGIFFASGRLLTRRHPVISVFSDRVWYRGLREQVVMLRNVTGVRAVRARRFGVPYSCIEMDLSDDDEPVLFVLWAVDYPAAELANLIASRAEIVQRDRMPG